MSFERFVETVGVRVRAGLVATYGYEPGRDAAAEAIAYAWEHWAEIGEMDNPAGYLYRVGQTAARRMRRPQGLLPSPGDDADVNVEPGLVPALQQLSEMQRTCVLLVVGYRISQAEVGRLLDVSASTVQTHIERAMQSLRTHLEVAHGSS
jgi:DNA-directed RNA polymerase specialized sigma24 family protein